MTTISQSQHTQDSNFAVRAGQQKHAKKNFSVPSLPKKHAERKLKAIVVLAAWHELVHLSGKQRKGVGAWSVDKAKKSRTIIPMNQTAPQCPRGCLCPNGCWPSAWMRDTRCRRYMNDTNFTESTTGNQFSALTPRTNILPRK